ncbi:MAG: hypothetical protein LC749_02380 [Actinobacteria bacterium]|nr:hypothetical protein [Actinomycetota bacterium]
MPDLADTLAAIDVVITGCAHCGKDRSDSPSDDFCSEACQRRWARRDMADLGAVHLEITIDTTGFLAAMARLEDFRLRQSFCPPAPTLYGINPS